VNQCYDRIFVHDDRIGPYASARFVVVERTRELHFEERTRELHFEERTRELHFEIVNPGGVPDRRPVRLAIVPLYPKLRSSAEDLWSNACEVCPPVKRGSEVSLELYFERAGSYAASLYVMNINAERLTRFQRKASLSRYVGVARWRIEGEPVLDTIWDTTDIRRRNRHDDGDGLLAVVALHPEYEAFADRYGEAYGVLAG